MDVTKYHRAIDVTKYHMYNVDATKYHTQCLQDVMKYHRSFDVTKYHIYNVDVTKYPKHNVCRYICTAESMRLRWPATAFYTPAPCRL